MKKYHTGTGFPLSHSDQFPSFPLRGNEGVVLRPSGARPHRNLHTISWIDTEVLPTHDGIGGE